MEPSGADEALAWVKDYTRTIRMEYGQAMALAGFDESAIIEVQEAVARSMLAWVARSM